MKRKNLIVIRKVEKENLSIKDFKVKTIYKKFKAIIFKKIKKDNFALAVSGGSDSLCLAYLSKMYSSEFKNKMHILIVDHKLRKESHKEALKVKKILKEKGLSNILSVEIELEDLLIPSIPCRTVSIKRTYDFESQKESIQILIDGDENELTKSVGYEVFINDFILPREIAKFFFFDAEKIVSLAEAKSKSELRSLSKAYSEVLGIKKYEELKKNLESLLTKLRRRGVNELQQAKLEALISEEEVLEKKINHNSDKQTEIDAQVSILKQKSDSLQEKLIREGNSITLEELKELKSKRDELKEEAKAIKNGLKKLLDLVPLVLAGKHLKRLKEQLERESNLLYGIIDKKLIEKELKSFSENILASLSALKLDDKIRSEVENNIKVQLESKLNSENKSTVTGKIYLEFAEERYREFQAIYNNIKTTFLTQSIELYPSKVIGGGVLSTKDGFLHTFTVNIEQK